MPSASVLSQIAESAMEKFYEQTLPGVIICYIILGAAALYLLWSCAVLGFYGRISRDIKRFSARGQNEINLDNLLKTRYMRRVNEWYTANFKVGIWESGNLADTAMPGHIRTLENLLTYFPTLSVSLGMGGTFVGLISALAQIKLSTSIESINEISLALASPMSDMSTAFVTSLCGLLASLIMNLLERTCRTHLRRGEVLANVEDFLRKRCIDLRLKNPAQMELSDPTVQTLKHSVDSFVVHAGKLDGQLGSLSTKLEAQALLQERLVAAIDSLRAGYQLEADSIQQIDLAMLRFVESHSRMIELNNDALHEQIQEGNRAFARMDDTYALLQQQNAHLTLLLDQLLNH